MEVKQSYQMKMEGQLIEWSSKLEECKDTVSRLKHRAGELEKQAKETCLESLDKVENVIEELRIKLEVGRAESEKLKETSEDVWGTVKAGVSMAWDDLSRGIETAWKDMQMTIEELSAKFK